MKTKHGSKSTSRPWGGKVFLLLASLVMILTMKQHRARDYVEQQQWATTTQISSSFFLSDDEDSDDEDSSRVLLPLCPATIQHLCGNDNHNEVSSKTLSPAEAALAVYKYQMVAIPHTASTSTNAFFQAGVRPTCNHNGTLMLERGGGGVEVVEEEVDNNNDTTALVPMKDVWDSCRFEASSSSTTTTMHTTLDASCTLSHLGYTGKKHSNYDDLVRPRTVPFTVLRLPEQLILSHYTIRKSWDEAQWSQEYNGSTLDDVSVEEWAERAWWRHNLFTKNMARGTKSANIWVRAIPQLHPTKEESDDQNNHAITGSSSSSWLESAWDRIQHGMPFFGLHHRMADSFELFSFSTCWVKPITDPKYVKFRPRKQKPMRKASPELQRIVNDTWKLDIELLQRAEQLFDQRLDAMRALKRQGYLCDLTSTVRYMERAAATTPAAANHLTTTTKTTTTSQGDDGTTNDRTDTVGVEVVPPATFGLRCGRTR